MSKLEELELIFERDVRGIPWGEEQHGRAYTLCKSLLAALRDSEAAIAIAPHHPTCAGWIPTLPDGLAAGDTRSDGRKMDASLCDCWKRGALSQHAHSTGQWVWADLYSPDETCETHPENPNVMCFTRVWLPK